MSRVSASSISLLVAFLFASAALAEPTTVLQQPNAPVARTLPEAPGDILLAQPPNQSNGIFSDASCDVCGAGAQAIADNFVLAAEETLGEITFYGGYFPTDTAPTSSTFRMIIHEDTLGVPGTVVYDESGILPTRTATGVTLFGVSEYEFVAELPNGPTLPAGTYWIQLFTDTGMGTDDFFWETGNLDAATGVAGSVYAFETPGVTWTVDPDTDMAIQIVAGGSRPSVLEIPTVNTVGLFVLAMVLGLAAFALLRRRTA